MHMTDALLSPTVGGAFVAVSGGVLAYSARRMSREGDERRVPLMGVLGAFVFAAQMINFAIPGTGSSGHLGGGMLLAILLGPYAAFLVLCSVLVVQCLFFADGGILALGTNAFNLGVWPCFLGLLVYRMIAGDRRLPGWRWIGSVVAVAVSLELGALGVVLQTILSGRSELPFGRFAALMMGIHLPIAVVEGVVTAAVVQFVRSLRPTVVNGAFARAAEPAAAGRRETMMPALLSLGALAILTGCVLAWFASASPDGLEWSLERAGAAQAAEAFSSIPALERLQEKTAFMPDYSLPPGETADSSADAQPVWPAVDAGTSVAGLVGAVLAFAIVSLAALLLYRLRPRARVSKT